MHKIKHSASPYIYEILLDNEYELSATDINTFEATVRRGVAVYGFTPNIIIVSNAKYSHWDSMSLFAEAMDTGKLAICSNDDLSDVIENIATDYASVKIKQFRGHEINDCKVWVTSGELSKRTQ